MRGCLSCSRYRLSQELGLLTKEEKDLGESVLYVQSGFEINGALVAVLLARKGTLGACFQLRWYSWAASSSIRNYLLA